MRYWVIGGLLAVAACTGGQELATTPPSPPETSSSSPATTRSSDAPETTRSTSTTLTTTAATTPSPPLETLAYVEVADLPFPIQVTARPGDDIAYVITKNGLVWMMEDGEVQPDPVLDISARVAGGREQGLLSIALHPTDDLFYLHYSASDGDTVISEFRFDSPKEASTTSERVLLRLDQPARNHNGGMIMFHPEDGRLLVGLGDGGGSGDRFGNGQNLDTLLGGIVSLSVAGGLPSLHCRCRAERL
jgi:glucose/arabinose dehydrogenase